MLAATAAELRDLMSRAVFSRDYGFLLESVGDGACTVRVPFDERLERPGGVVGGPAFMAAADVATWLAILARLGAGDRSVTSSLATTFLAPARREDFLCTARIHRLGRRMIYATAECLGGDGRLLTHHTVTYVRPDAPATG
jgi:uncharacterized protein (TIGR00369 family)